MQKRVRWLFGLLLIMGLLTGCQAPAKTGRSQATRPVPTLFFHGYGSSINAEKQMVRAAQRAGVTNSVVQATVAKDGRVHLTGHFQRGDQHPIVEVGFLDNRNGDYPTVGRWMRNVVLALQKRDHVKSFNVVGHSMGNLAIAYYLLAYGQRRDYPQLRKQVDIAGHYNGVLGMDDEPNRMRLTQNGRPTKMIKTYRQLIRLRQSYPNHQIDVLNIYGDLNDGSHSDGRVSNASSKSLRYLVADRAKSYREQRVVGPQAQHSKLHDNVTVNRALIKFIWGE